MVAKVSQRSGVYRLGDHARFWRSKWPTCEACHCLRAVPVRLARRLRLVAVSPELGDVTQGQRAAVAAGTPQSRVVVGNGSMAGDGHDGEGDRCRPGWA
jgi:hypothetical protein